VQAILPMRAPPRVQPPTAGGTPPHSTAAQTAHARCADLASTHKPTLGYDQQVPGKCRGAQALRKHKPPALRKPPPTGLPIRVQETARLLSYGFYKLRPPRKDFQIVNAGLVLRYTCTNQAAWLLAINAVGGAAATSLQHRFCDELGTVSRVWLQHQ
jgi:hypothetical protein